MLLASSPLASNVLADGPLGIIYRLTVSTQILNLPINCVLAGQQSYDQGGYDVEDVAPNYNVDIKVSFGGEVLSKGNPMFTVKTGNRGYD